jgi:predicted metal-dependent hydrolase
MQKSFTKNNTVFLYTLKNRKGIRGIRIAVHADGAVVVTKSKYIRESEIERLVEKKADWIIEKIDLMKSKPKKLLAHYSAKDFKENKEKALHFVLGRIEYLNKFYTFKVNSIGIKNQKTRWGSCSGKGNLSFNYKIIFLPVHLADYIIVHELCHLKEMNHSPRFWSLVAEQIPDHKIRRKEVHLY